MALVLLSPLNTLATHGSSVASSWVSTGLTFSFPPKPPLTQNPSFTDIHGPHPTAQLPAVNPIPLHSEESDRTMREAGERESAGTPRPPRFVEAAGFEARAHPPLLPPAARPRLSEAKIQLGREEGRPLCGRPLRRRGLLPQTLAAAAWPWRFGLRSGDNVAQSKEP